MFTRIVFQWFMDKPISVGDLVQVVFPRECGHAQKLGSVFVVGKILPTRTACPTCSHEEMKQDCAETHTGGCTPLYRLKRIPPLEELEGREENLKEPA
jgi:hypothetical protein